MILPYRLLEPRLEALRRGSHTVAGLYLYCLVVFALASVAGGALYAYVSGPAYALLMEPTINGINMLSGCGEGSPLCGSLAIFLKNTTAVAVAAGLARRTRGISIALLLVVNGLIIGSLLTTLGVNGYPMVALAVGFLTHGALELGAVFLGAGAGLWLLLARDEHLAHRKERCMRLFIAAVVPLIMAAALIEGFITPVLLNRMLG